ncbi:gp49 [Salmonella phage FO1a]|nr:gp49 [Salmonella phage FO1a]
MCLSAKQVYKGSSPFGFSKLFYSLSIKIIIMPCYKYSSFRYRRVFLDRAFLQSYTL